MPIFFKKSSKKDNLVLFIHGFTGGMGTWVNSSNKKFHELLLDEEGIKENFDFAYYEYRSKPVDFYKTRILFGFFLSIISSRKNPIKKNQNITDIAKILEVEGGECFSNYKCIHIISHSMGGMVAKEYANLCFKKKNKKIKQIITLATPHLGVCNASILNIFLSNKQVGNLGQTSEKIWDINRRWEEFCKKEVKITYFHGLNDELINKISSTYNDVSDQSNEAFDEDHISISKPFSKDDPILVSCSKILKESIHHKKEKILKNKIYQSTLSKNYSFAKNETEKLKYLSQAANKVNLIINCIDISDRFYFLNKIDKIKKDIDKNIVEISPNNGFLYEIFNSLEILNREISKYQQGELDNV